MFLIAVGRTILIDAHDIIRTPAGGTEDTDAEDEDTIGGGTRTITGRGAMDITVERAIDMAGPIAIDIIGVLATEINALHKPLGPMSTW